MTRLYIEPHLRAELHWQHGFARMSDSAFFYQAAVSFQHDLASAGWRALASDRVPGAWHVKFIGTVFHVAGTATPWTIFGLNALASCVSAAILAGILARLGVGLRRARLIAVVLSLSPSWLFHHSELVREPYIAVALYVLLYAVVRLLSPDRAAGRAAAISDVAAVAALVGSYTVLTSFRPYLLLPVVLSLATMLVAAAVWQLAGSRRSRPGWGRLAALGAGVAVSILVVTWPGLGRVREYAETSSTVRPAVEARRQPARDARAEAEARFRRRLEGVVRSAPCTIDWRPTAGLPAPLEDKLLAISCARQKFQIWCDVAAVGLMADRNCDEATLASAGDFIRHLPAAMAFGMLSPSRTCGWRDSGAAGPAFVASGT